MDFSNFTSTTHIKRHRIEIENIVLPTRAQLVFDSKRKTTILKGPLHHTPRHTGLQKNTLLRKKNLKKPLSPAAQTFKPKN